MHLAPLIGSEPIDIKCIAHGLCAGMQYLHNQEIVVGTIRPEEIAMRHGQPLIDIVQTIKG